MKIFSLLLASILIISYSDENSEYFSLKNNDRIIPIEVKGNTSSDILIVRLSHLGISYDEVYNGNCSRYYNCIHYKYFHSNSIGNYCDTISCSLSNLRTDLDLLIYTLDQKYGDSKSIFLYGNGLAASIILYYASKGAYWNYLDGIIINGAILNIRRTIEASKEKVTELLQNEINRTNNESLESRLGQFLEELNEIDANTVSAIKYYQFLSNKFRFPDNLFDDIETIDFDCLYSEFDGTFGFDRFDIIEEDLTNIVQDIRMPVLMLWMEDEFLNPISIGQELFGLLEISEKEFYTSEYICNMIYGNGNDIDRSEHYGSYTRKIDNFIEKYK